MEPRTELFYRPTREIEARDRHCGAAACRCDHDVECYRGWLEWDSNSAKPCAVCRPATRAKVRGGIR